MSKSARALERVIDPNEVLRVAKLEPDSLQPRHGWSNQAWVGSRFVVRVSSGRLHGSFAHERRIVDLLAWSGIPIAPVLASGTVDQLSGQHGEAGEWIVTTRLAGNTLASVWTDLDDDARSAVGRQLGSALQALHGIDADAVAPRWWEDAHSTAMMRNAYRPRVSLGPALAQAARDLPHADGPLLDDVEAMLHDRMRLFARDPSVLVHADVHGHNVLVDPHDPVITGLLDWEGAHTAAADVELDMLLRWVSAAHDFPEGPGRPSRIAVGDCVRLVRDVAAAYPALFDGPHLVDRLEVYDAHWHLVQLLFDAYWTANGPASNDGPPAAWSRLRLLLDGRSHLRDLGLR